jgi:ribosomal protein L7/L12/uncharacterized coiled-coil protein SlyX
MSEQVANLINMLVSADAREQELNQDINEQTDLVAELRDQKAVDADYIQRMEAQVAALLARVEDAQREIDDGARRFYELKRQHSDLRSQWATTSDAMEMAHEKIAVLEGKMTLDDLLNAWRGVQIGMDAYVPESWRAEFANFVTCMDSNQKINAIKSVRAMTGAGLKVSKEFVEVKKL